MSEPRNRLISILQNPESVRRESFNGKEHIVLPAVVLVEGVIHGSGAPFPELALASEFGKFLASWNGRPVTLGHPKREGNFVSAGASPEVFGTEKIGTVFNARLDGDRLKVEFFVDPDLISEDEITRLESGGTVEVSTGFFAEVVPVEETTFKDGRVFQGIQMNIVPDHIAILTEGTIGACSVADGCGVPRLNELRANGKLIIEGNCSGGTGCTCPKVADKHKPEEDEEEKKRKAKVKKKKADRANATKFSDERLIQLGEDGELLSLGEDVTSADLTTTDESYVVASERMDKVIAGPFSDRKEAEGIANALADARGEWIFVLKAEGTRAGGELVFRPVMTFMGNFRDFEKSTSAKVAQFLLDKGKKFLETLGTKQLGSADNPTPNTNEEMEMAKRESIDALIANSAAPWDKDDMEALEVFSEAQLEGMVKAFAVKEETLAPAPTPAAPAPAAITPNAAAAPAAAEVSAADFIANGEAMQHLPKEVQMWMTAGLATQTAAKTVIVKALVDAKYPETEEILMAKELSELTALSAWVTAQAPSDFSGLGAGRAHASDQVAVLENGMFSAPKAS